MTGMSKNEALWSERVRFNIHNQARKKTYKISDRIQRGLPDIYIPGGLWCESKIIPYGVIDNRRKIKSRPITNFSTSQRWVMDNLVKDGDAVIVSVLWAVDYSTTRYMFMPWHVFRHVIQWTITDLMHFSDELKSKDIKLPNFWEKPTEYNWFRHKFASWEGKFDQKLFDTSTTSDFWYYENGLLIGTKMNPLNISKLAKVAVGSDEKTWLQLDEEEDIKISEI